eukprot:2711272-Pyramimonas_sp.AAC.1
MDFPFLFLKVLEEPSAERSETRKTIASLLLEKRDCCLEEMHGDLSLKAKAMFRDAWETMRDTGTCRADLYAWLLILRSRMPFDTQEVEGMNSVIQIMTRIAPSMRLPLTSHRVRIKKGDPISVEECIAVDKQVREEMAT